MKAWRGGGRVIAVLFLNFGARWGWLVNATLQPFHPRARQPVPIVQEAGWAPGASLDRCVKSCRTRIRSPDRPPVASRYHITYRVLFSFVEDVPVAVTLCTYAPDVSYFIIHLICNLLWLWLEFHYFLFISPSLYQFLSRDLIFSIVTFVYFLTYGLAKGRSFLTF
jgi:hypothetical protein